MHPNRIFEWTDREEMLAFVQAVSFATICADGPVVVHAPVTVSGGGDRLLFHLSKKNRAVQSLDRGRAIASLLGPDYYVSPDWYGIADQVPTWNYLAVEVEGPVRRLDAKETAATLDELSASHEARLAPKPVWTRGKMSPGRFDAMVKAILGFELRIESLRGTRKLGQHKAPEQRQRVAEALSALGREDAAQLARP